MGGTTAAAVALIDALDQQVDAGESGSFVTSAPTTLCALLMTAPGIAWVLGDTIAAELATLVASLTQEAGRLHRARPPCLPVRRSRSPRPAGEERPDLPAMALIEAATHAARHPCYADHDQRTKTRLGKQRGPAVARVEIARKLAEAIWYMLTKQVRFAPARPHTRALVA